MGVLEPRLDNPEIVFVLAEALAAAIP